MKKKGTQFMYHEAPSRERESIRSGGLRPAKEWTLGYGEHTQTVPAGVYMSRHGNSEYGSSMHDSSWYGYDRWRVDTTDLPVHADPTQPDSAHYTPEHVTPDRIKLAKKGHPDWEAHI